MTTRRTPANYKWALKWLLDNDDTEWLEDEDFIPSVSTCLVADIYMRSTDEVTNDLLALRDKEKKKT